MLKEYLRIIGWRFCHARDRAVSKRNGSERNHAIDGTKYYSTASYRVSQRWAQPSCHIGPEGTCHLQRDCIGQKWFHSTWKYPSWFFTVSGSVVRFHPRHNRHGPLGCSRNQDISVRITFVTTITLEFTRGRNYLTLPNKRWLDGRDKPKDFLWDLRVRGGWTCVEEGSPGTLAARSKVSQDNSRCSLSENVRPGSFSCRRKFESSTWGGGHPNCSGRGGSRWTVSVPGACAPGDVWRGRHTRTILMNTNLWKKFHAFEFYSAAPGSQLHVSLLGLLGNTTCLSSAFLVETELVLCLFLSHILTSLSEAWAETSRLSLQSCFRRLKSHQQFLEDWGQLWESADS